MEAPRRKNRQSKARLGLFLFSLFLVLPISLALTHPSSSSSRMTTQTETTTSIAMTAERSSTPTPPAVVEAVTDVHPDVVEVVEAIKDELKEEGMPELKPLNYVFGYGSLICKKSRAITAPTLADKQAIPVQVNNVERVWAKRTKRGMTAMGVRFRKGASCNGVLLPVSEEELMRFDKREVGYDRYLIPLDHIETVPFLEEKNHYEKMDYENADVLFDNEDAAAENTNTNSTKSSSTTTDNPPNTTDGSEHKVFIWVYVQRYDCPADENFPIAQSYVDIIMRGCMAIDKEFARDFIETTKGWSPEEVYGLGDSDDDVNDSEDEEEEKKEQEEYCATLAQKKEEEIKDEVNNAAADGSHWVDDREDPIYMRADPVFSEKKGDVIDQLLEDHIPEHLDNREPLVDEEKVMTSECEPSPYDTQSNKLQV